MILVRNLSLPAEESFSMLLPLALRKLRLSPDRVRSWQLVRRSLDARKKDRIHWVCSVALSVSGEDLLLRHSSSPDVSSYLPPVYTVPELRSPERPVVVGFGPAGMFAALVLAKAGLRPLVFERGQDARTRRAAIDRFHAGGALDPECNVQFGEGGAGTFSDGKLNTGTHDPRISWVLRQFHQYGAPESVLYDAKPHIGTDVLIDVVQNIRRGILALGGEVRFGTRLERLLLRDGRITGIQLRSGKSEFSLPCSRVILAIGHSARDTLEALLSQGIPMERKAFAMGLRIEHRQQEIDRIQYGRDRGILPATDYSLHTHLSDGTGVFSFCMCPGGQVFAAASETGGIVTNGMSFSARDGENANAALLVGLQPDDFPGGGILAGMYWQRAIEQTAFQVSGTYRAPAQLLGDFLAYRASTGFVSVCPSYRPAPVWTDLHSVLPEKITAPLEAAIPIFDRKLPGFADPDAVLTAPETRSSSPVRILRDRSFSSSVGGLYPCGEGAGYAGGITSAAVDGMRCAEAVISSLAVDGA